MPSDLAKHRMSVGGKMAKWPLRPIWQTCRDRHSIQSENVSAFFLEQTLTELRDLRDEAESLGMDTEDLSDVIQTLEYVEGSDVIRAVNVAYQAKYETSDDLTNEKCPYEETGNESMCKTCPVGKTALGKLKRKRKNGRGRTQSE